MTYTMFLARLKPWMLPIAMLGGIVLHNYIGMIAFLAPYLIFVMLLITFCKVNPRELRPTSLTARLLVVQLGVAVGVYFLLALWDPVIAQGTFICIFCPTATAAPVITGMLGGSIARVATFSIFSNIAVALTAPLLFSMMGADALGFVDNTLAIAMRVMPMIFIPLILAFILRWRVPKLHKVIATHQSISFYIWALSLFIVVGNAVSFVMNEPPGAIPEMLLLALFSGIACCFQFAVGRKIGRACGDRIVGAQALGQKNTVLAIWMALSWLDPIASVAPAAYVAWQNTINSAQLYYKSRSGK